MVPHLEGLKCEEPNENTVKQKCETGDPWKEHVGIADLKYYE